MADTAVAITVIYPVHELRGDFVSPLRSWTREQTLARDRYRVLVVCGEADRGHTAAMQSLLGPNDEWLQVRGRGYGLLLNAGSARVRTPWLVMTEGHCVAEPGCLEAVMRWIEANPDGQVGNFDLIHPNDGIVSRLVARWYDDLLMQWSTPPNWPHAISGGVAIRRSLLDEVGAMEPDFGAFAPHVQSARLYSRGVKVQRVPGAAVLHLDERSMAEFCESTASYIRGELVARSRLDPAFLEHFFGDAYIWSNPRRFQRGTALALARALIAAARASPRRAAAHVGALVSLLAEAAAGLRLRIAVNSLTLALDAITIERLPIPEGLRWRRFLRSHQRTVRLTQLRWLLRNPVVATDAGLSEGRWAIERLGPNDIVGVHGLEEFGGRRFRWIEPVAMIRTAPRQTSCELRIETGGIRGDPLRSLLAVIVAGRALPRKYCTSDDRGTLTIHLPAAFAAAANDGVALVCDPLSPRRAGTPDRRSLGLPVVSIAIAPAPQNGDLR
jgi:hypothetical protein